jgi:hypothetical protein
MRQFESFGYLSSVNPMGKAVGSHLNFLVFIVAFIALIVTFVDLRFIVFLASPLREVSDAQHGDLYR